MLKNKYKKILICSALIAAISIPLVGCGSEDADTSTKTEDKQQTTDGASTESGDKTSDTTEKTDGEITKEMEDATTKKLKENSAVENVTYEVKDKDVTIKMQVKEGTDEEAAKGLVKIAMQQLSTESTGKAPEGDSLGDLWNKYNLKAEVFSGDNNTVVAAEKDLGQDKELSFKK